MSTPDLSTLRLGTAPDSWGVWFPEDTHQVGWQQYLDDLDQSQRPGHSYICQCQHHSYRGRVQ